MNAVALDDGARKVAPAVAYARVVARAHEADILECEHIAHDGRIVSRSRRCPSRQLRLIETRIARIRDRYLCRKCRLRRDECPPPEDNARATKRARERRFIFFPIKSASCILIPKEPLINSVPSSWRIFFARFSSANPPQSTTLRPVCLLNRTKKSTPI